MNLLKNLKWGLLTVAIILATISCKKELNQLNPSDYPSDGQTMEELVVDENFDFATSQILNIKITSSDLLGMPASKIEIYNGNPNESGMIVKTGISNREQVFSTQVNIPSSQEALYIRRTSSDGAIETVTIDILGEEIEYAFSANKSQVNFKSNVSGPGCDEYTDIVTQTSGTLRVKKNKVYVLQSGSSFTGKVKMEDGTLKVCGNITITELEGNKGTLIINDDGVLIANSFDIDHKDIIVENYSDAFMVSSGPEIKGTFKNYGTLNMSGAEIKKDGEFSNYGTVNFSGNFINDESTYNEGIINFAGNVTNDEDGEFENHCTLNVSGNFTNKNKLKNYSYINITGTLECEDHGDLDLYDQSLIETTNLILDEDVEAHGDEYSKIVITNNTTIENIDLKGNLDICDENGIESDDGDAESSVTYCEASIPQTACNPGSNASGGNAGGDDADGDGVADDFDDYPNDGDRAFNNYFPDENTFGTLAFEDLWPYKGDYDFNDLVVDYQFNTVTNANDNAVEIYVSLSVKAIGAAFKNGFGIELPIGPDAVQQVSGDFSLTQSLINLDNKNLETNQSNAVIVFFDNAFDLLPHPGDGTGVNTRIGASYVEPQIINFLVSFNYPVSVDNLGQAPFNPFIFVHGDRGREIHMKNDAPTDLVNASLFGTGEDNSSPADGLYYNTVNNLPWAINITEGFDYPLEKTPTINAYNHFAQWAESGGAEYPDWYSDSPGYRNSNYIYSAF